MKCLKSKILTPFIHSSYLLPDDSAGRIAREPWWTSQEFSSASIINSPCFSQAHMSPGGQTTGPLVAAVQRHNLTPIDTINGSIKVDAHIHRHEKNYNPKNNAIK
jgi:hypothetical protein